MSKKKKKIPYTVDIQIVKYLEEKSFLFIRPVIFH